MPSVYGTCAEFGTPRFCFFTQMKFVFRAKGASFFGTDLNFMLTNDQIKILKPRFKSVRSGKRILEISSPRKKSFATERTSKVKNLFFMIFVLDIIFLF